MNFNQEIYLFKFCTFQSLIIMIVLYTFLKHVHISCMHFPQKLIDFDSMDCNVLFNFPCMKTFAKFWSCINATNGVNGKRFMHTCSVRQFSNMTDRHNTANCQTQPVDGHNTAN